MKSEKDNKLPEKIARLVSYVECKMEEIKEIPDVIVDRAAKIGTLSFLILILGCFFTKQMGWNFLLCSVAISLFGFIQVVRLFCSAKRKEYEVIEGIVLTTKGRHIPGRFYTVTLEIESGKQTQLLMDKRNRLQKGKKYRLYFSKKSQGSLSGIKRLDAALNMGTFYGCQEVE